MDDKSDGNSEDEDGNDDDGDQDGNDDGHGHGHDQLPPPSRLLLLDLHLLPAQSLILFLGSLSQCQNRFSPRPDLKHPP